MKLLQEAEFELSEALNLLVEFSGNSKEEVFGYSKVKGMVETRNKLRKELETATKLTRPIVQPKYTKGDWQITGETANMIIVKSIHASTGHKRTVAQIPFTTSRQDEMFGITDLHDAKLIANAPKLKQIAEMFFDYLENGDGKGGITHGIIAETLKAIND